MVFCISFYNEHSNIHHTAKIELLKQQMHWLVQLQGANYNLICSTGCCYDCIIKDICTIINYHV